MRSSIGLSLSVVYSMTTLACGSQNPLTVDRAPSGGSTGAAGLAGLGDITRPYDGGSDGAPDAGACGNPYANSSMPMAPCAADSDCHSAYLFCGPPQATVEACHDANAPVDECAAPAFADLPICPVTKRITANLCGIRYQRPCNTDSDCGPGITCTLGDASTCSIGATCGTCETPPRAACVTKADCPKEWDCYTPCACAANATNAQTSCFPPFERFNCPECAPTPG